jgi:hypothetical protein
MAFYPFMGIQHAVVAINEKFEEVVKEAIQISNCRIG